MWVWKPEGNLKAGQAHTAKETNTMVKEEWTEKGYIDEPADNTSTHGKRNKHYG